MFSRFFHGEETGDQRERERVCGVEMSNGDQPRGKFSPVNFLVRIPILLSTGGKKKFKTCGLWIAIL